jgi:hypothetical protein
MKIPSSDPHQIGPDDVLMTSVGGCYTMSFSIALINLITSFLGPSDLESPQESAPSDTYIIYFKLVLRCSRII